MGQNQGFSPTLFLKGVVTDLHVTFPSRRYKLAYYIANGACWLENYEGFSRGTFFVSQEAALSTQVFSGFSKNGMCLAISSLTLSRS